MYFYIRSNRDSPARAFYDHCQRPLRNKFDGSFETLVKLGQSYENQERFKALKGPGKPLWEFKEGDARIYCERIVYAENGSVQAFLLLGWAKDKTKGREESNKINSAMTIYQERLKEGFSR